MTSEELRAFREAEQVLLTLLRCISMKRALAVSNDRLNFFRIYDACLMDASVISWCKIFGSRREDLHWERMFPNSTIDYRRIKQEIMVAAGGDLDDLSIRIRKYRDTFVAHHDLDTAKRATHHPSLGSLQATGQVLYREIYHALIEVGAAYGLPTPEQIVGSNLQETEAKWKSIADVARAATAKLSDS